jgi:threonine dehydratase
MIDPKKIISADQIIRPYVRHTPLMTSPTMNSLCGCVSPSDFIHFKAENLQRTGSFKIRGAYYHISCLSDSEKARGVVCASAGNHAQGVAQSAQLLGLKSTVIMPESASLAKIRATAHYGADVHLEGRTLDEAIIAAQSFQKHYKAVYISPFDDDNIITGQGTLGLEIVKDLPDVETALIPIGGGGLFSGVARALKAHNPNIRIIGVQAEGADTARRSLKAGTLLQRVEPITTICDGIAVKSPSKRTFEYIQTLADDIVTVKDFDVATSLLHLLERMKLVVEPAGAVGVAALISGKVKPSGATCVVLSGGNIDLKILSDMIQREMLKNHRYLHIFTRILDKPGHLAKLLECVATQRGNLITVNHNRISPSVPLGETAVELLIEVRDEEHAEMVISGLKRNGYTVTMLETE